MSSGTERRRMAKQVLVRMDDEMLLALQELSRANGRTVSQTVRFLLSGHIGDAAASSVRCADRSFNHDFKGETRCPACGFGGIEL